jgi:DNA-3-methyladenine glycosylase
LPSIIFIDAGIKIDKNNIKKTPRIGINYAKAWSKEPLRFVISRSGIF